MDGEATAGIDARRGTYVLDTAQPMEKQRLDEQATLIDPFTFGRLDHVGVAAGWRCLEVGGGAGSVVSWLCQRVGPAGQVVATDLETRWLEGLAASNPNLQVRRHDVVVDPLEDSAYDLIHARLVLAFLPRRDAVVTKLVSALRPGGWLVVEEPDAHTFGTSHPHHATWAKVATAMRRALESAGVDTTYGRKLPASLRSAGLTDLNVEGLLTPGLAPDLASPIVLPMLDRLRDPILTMGSASATEIDSIVDEFRDQDSSLWIYPTIVVSARGRRPGP